jgi:hypothetical protein
MPIRPEMKALYPADWPLISLRIRNERAKGRCECTGECGTHAIAWAPCPATNGKPHPITRSVVVLTVAHLNHDPRDCRDENLKAMCQKCHLNYDADHHAETRKATKAAALLAAGIKPLFDLTPEERP